MDSECRKGGWARLGGVSARKELEYCPQRGGTGGAVGRSVRGKVVVIALVFLLTYCSVGILWLVPEIFLQDLT